MAICLIAATGSIRLAAAAFTLVWMHSVEKIDWEEDYAVDGPSLVLQEVRLRGSGAGMDPAPEARFADGRWSWNPATRLPALDLRRSGATADWRLCIQGRCQPMAHWLPPEADPVRIAICP